MEFVVIASSGIENFATVVVDGIRELGGEVEYRTVAVSAFADHAQDVYIPVNVRKRNVYLLHNFVTPNDGYMQLFLFNDAIKRASANEIINVLPYIPYTRKDRKDMARVPISAKLLAQLTEASGANRIITNDLHAGQIQGFYDIPVDNLEALPYLASYIQENYRKMLKDLIVVAPDTGATRIARGLAKRLKTDIAIIDKRRLEANQTEVLQVVGNVRGKNCLMFDDMIDTGSTICQGAKALKENGAVAVYAGCTHAIFSTINGKPAENRLLAEVEEVIVTDSIPCELESDRIRVVSLAELYSEAIYRTQVGKSLSELFQ